MSKTKIITSILCLTIFIHGMSKASTFINADFVDYHSSKIDLSQSNDPNINYSFFEVNIMEAGDYYAEFWLLPAKYTDGSYTRFSIFANDEFVGNIKPEKGNWQSARIDGNNRIRLHKGSNIIKIAVPAPEIPAVETIKFAITDAEDLISSSDYQKFLDKAEAGISYDMPKEETCISLSSISTQSNNSTEFPIKQFSDVPLIYTFYTKFKFQKDEIVNISTSSLSEHDVDILYLSDGNYLNFQALNATQNSYSEDSAGSDINEIGALGFNPDLESPKIKINESFYLASSEEMQGLNWKGLSTKLYNSQNNTISKNIKIPYTGNYLIRLRHRQTGKTGVADLSVNGVYSYQNVPISFSWVACEIPANDKEYGTMTICNDPQKDDPIIFMHGADADRIIGFRDDAPSKMRMIHELSRYDSHILQQYKVKTSGISVCNYSSSEPESKCEILAGIDESLFELDPSLQLKPKKNGSNNSPYCLARFNGVRTSESLEQNGVLNVSSQSNIHHVTVSDLSGNIIKSFKGQGTDFSIPVSLLNIKNAGIYVVIVETENGSLSKKMFLK